MKSRHDLDKINPFGLDAAPNPFRKKSKLRGDDYDYMRSVSEALLAQSTPASSAVLYLIIALTTIALVWASISKVDEVTLAEARVIPSSREQVISSLEGGVLSELLVGEGDEVAKGQPIVRLEPTRFESQYREGISKQLSLKATRARARAEAYNLPLDFPPEVRANPALVSNETKAYEARKRVLEESVAALRKSQDLIANEIAISEELSKQGLFSEVELSRLRRQENDLNQQVMERVNRFRAEANTELTRAEAELGQLAPNLSARLDTLQRTTLRAPVKGIVKNIRYTTIGAAVSPSAPILDIVPVDETLLFEARLDPKDVSHVSVGLPVSIKLSAYDTAIYGELQGKVELVSPDTFREDMRPIEGQPMNYYRVMISAAIDPAHPKQKDMQIIPGLQATTQIKTGNKTIMQYLMKPVSKARDAFRER
jgi:adhesin transport system membrane fusion protein